MPLSQSEKEELLAVAASRSMREDAARLVSARAERFMVDGEVSADLFTEFLTEYNAFLNHPRKPFRPFREGLMKL